MAILDVHHRTVYSYDRSVGFGVHRWMFRPRDSQEQRLLSSERRVSPEPAGVVWQHDVFGNQVALVEFDSSAAELVFESDISLEHSPELGLRYTAEDEGRGWPLEYDAAVLPDLAAYRRVHYPDPNVADWAKSLVPEGRVSTIRLLERLNGAVRETCGYARRYSPGTQPPSVTLGEKRGTCRDLALLMMEAARELGFAARFVTGYIYAPSRDKASVQGGGATHAWVQVFLPGAGWVEFDPTNGIVGSRDLVRIGVARDPSQAKPLGGSFKGPAEAYLGMQVDVVVRRQDYRATARPEATRPL
jgi:transglutaminase-like putative cysteine protease